MREKARQAAEERVLDLLLPPLPPAADYDDQAASIREQAQRTREKLREQLRDGRLDHKQVEIDVREKSFPSFEIIAGSSVEEVDINVKDMLPGLFQGRTKKRKLRIPEALEALAQEEEQKLVDMDTVARAAVERVQQAGIIFIDEIDKVAGREGGHGPDVSREGVQRDILPIVEGTTVNTKYGMVKTDHILFIAAGAFHVSKPSDLIPELQGRFPIRVELEALGREDFVRILTEPKSALVKQYTALLSTEGVTIRPSPTARSAASPTSPTLVNERTENIGARRLHTVMEKLLDEVSFDAPDLTEQERHDRRSLRRSHARRHRPQRRPVALRPVMRTAARPGGGPSRPRHRCRADDRVREEGPPLAPLHLVPAPVTELTVRRVERPRAAALRAAHDERQRPGPARSRSCRDLRDHGSAGFVPPNRLLMSKEYLVGGGGGAAAAG